MIRILQSTAAAVLLAAATTAFASGGFRSPDSDFDPSVLRIDEKQFLGQKMSDEYTLIDDTGKEFTMASLRGMSQVLVMSYYTCDGACPAFNQEVSQLIQEAMALGKMKIGDDFQVLTISFDKNDTAMSARHFRSMLDLPQALGGNWTFATFKNPESIGAFTSAIDYRFFWSAPDQMFFHPNAVIFLSPEGRIVRVLQDTSRMDANDMELALIDTNFNRLGPSQIITLAVSFCYSYNYKEGKYGLNYPLFFAMGSLFLGIGAFVFGAFRIKKRDKVKETVA